MLFPVPAPDWGIGVATHALLVSPTLAWGRILGVLGLACVGLWLVREIEEAPEAKRDAEELKRAA